MGMDDLRMLFQFAGGLGMFLYGMNAMADGLQRSAGHRMQQLLGALIGNRIMGVLVGAAITAVIQSSSATTVMVVGFVNAGIMNLTQAVGVIMGANIGTTVTSWLVSMNEWGEMLSPEFFAPLLIGIGAAAMLFAKSQKKREMGEILVGFGILFVGLSFMSGAVKPYRDAPVFSHAFAAMGKNPILGILAGLVVTAVIQSSSASVGILQTLALNGIVNWQSAIFITLGQNIGTCVTALLSSIGAHKTAKQAAAIHLMFNVAGAVIFGILMFVLFLMNPSWASSSISSVQISVFHTIFNVGNTILLFPFAGLLVKAARSLVKEKRKEEGQESGEEAMVRHLDDRILETPIFALENVNKEVVRMGQTVLENLKLARQALLENDGRVASQVMENERTIDKMEKLLTEYLVKINNLSLNDEQHLMVKNLFYTVGDLERIGDHCENLAELACQKIDGDIQFSDNALSEMEEITNLALSSAYHAVQARDTGEKIEVRAVIKHEEQMDNLEEDLRERHITRLSENLCRTESGVIFLDAISNLERISDHAHNIASYVMDEM